MTPTIVEVINEAMEEGKRIAADRPTPTLAEIDQLAKETLENAMAIQDPLLRAGAVLISGILHANARAHVVRVAAEVAKAREGTGKPPAPKAR